MSRTIAPGELGLIVVPFIANENAVLEGSLDGMEDTMVQAIELDLVVEETLCARVLRIPSELPVPESNPNPMFDVEDYKELLRERALDAADVAAAIMQGDAEVDALVRPWLERKNGHKPSVIR